ncbi:MAG: ABC transporter ATP-binding protein, partial [Nitrospira sp.]|nr:ABC transporter ATP-binding protein [Nitrospira sp.]
LWVIALSVVSALLQSVGIGLLLPALQLVERPEALTQSGFVWRAINTALGAVHMPVTLATLLCAILVTIVAGQALFYGQQRASSALTRDLVAPLGRRLFRSLMRADLSLHNCARTGSFVNNVTLDTSRTGVVFDGVLQVISRALLFAFYAIMLFFISWQMSLGALILIAAASGLVHHQTRRSGDLGHKVVQAASSVHAFAMERLGCARIVKLRNAVEADSERFAQISWGYAAAKCQHDQEAAKIRFLMEPTLAAGAIIATYVGFTLFSMSLSQLAVFMFVLIRMVPEAYTLNRLRHTVVGNLGHFHNVMAALEESARRTTILSGSRGFPGLRRNIEFQNVTVEHEPGKAVLKDVTLCIDANCVTAIVGPSAAGKSTLLDLIARLVDPCRGEILLDGINIREYDLGSLRSQIGMVSQDILLLNDTVLENIRYGHPEASEMDVVSAATRANAHGFIQHLPQGYATVLGPRGLTLSGGERQRIELARALLHDPSILLLDEVTSSLDAESEKLIQESVFELSRGRTIIVVTHRLNLARHAQKVIVLEAGRVVEQGPPGELLLGNGLFRRHVQLQTMGVSEPR